LKVAVVGVGRMGRRHMQVVRELGLELTGICDSSADALHAVQKEQHVTPAVAFKDIQTLLVTAKPECVIIATTAPTHCEYTCAAAEAGASFILCEKPMATSLADCDRMLASCAKHGARLAINHQMRFMEQYTLPKSMLTSEKFGGLSSVNVIAGNFGLAMNGSHYFEMFRYLTDEVPDKITAWFSPGNVPNPRGPQFEDMAGCVRVETASAKRFYMDCSGDQGHSMRVLYAARFGQIFVDELTGEMSATAREVQYRELPTTRYGMPAAAEKRVIAPADAVAPTKAVLQALLAGKNWPTGEDGRLAVSTLVAAYVSHESGNVALHLSDTRVDRERTFPWA
jgi:predicted dehydrogenase